MLFDVLKMGGLGGICVASHVVGPRLAEMARLVRAGDVAGAERLDESLRALYKTLCLTANPILIKEALNLLGHEVGGLRLPLVPATPEESAAVADELRRLGMSSRA
jgi:4-hydroxy-tetrahydrodipicolinate synthase